jgi:hypothetical protein
MAAIATTPRPSAPGKRTVVYPLSVGGRLLPTNVALEFSLQFESVIADGILPVLDDPAEVRRTMYGRICKYFPGLAPGREYRQIADQELKRTSVYAIRIASWGSKRYWDERDEQSDGWAPLGEELFR